MSSSQPIHDIPAEVIDAAIEWTVRLDFNSPTADTRAAFERWLQMTPLHGEAWRRMQALRQNFAGVPPLLALDTLQAATQLRRKDAALQRRQLLKLLGLSAAVAGVGWQSRDALPWQRLMADISTGVGEQRSLRLVDGTVATLNTDTALRSAMDSTQRVLHLDRGEIHVAGQAAADAPAAQQLRVRMPVGEVRAPGADFVVRLLPERARVTVLRGSAHLFAADADVPTVARTGESWWLGRGVAQPAKELPFDAGGWVDGVVTAKNMRLAELLAELERYRHGRIHCDANLANLPISGIYHIHDTDRALRFLAQTQSLRLDYRTRFWVAVRPATA